LQVWNPLPPCVRGRHAEQRRGAPLQHACKAGACNPDARTIVGLESERARAA
jgi:hypothetical protein